MMSTLSYNLTEYTDFRKLEFQYSKSRDENAELKSKLSTIQHMYRQTIEDFQKQKLEWYKAQAKLKASAFEAVDKVDDLISFSEHIHNELKNFENMGIDLGFDFEEKDYDPKLDRIEHTKWIFNEMIKSMMIVLNKNNDLALKYEKQSSLLKNETRQNKRREKDLKEEISYLSEQIAKFQNTNTSLMNQLNILKRENMDYKLQIYELNKQPKEESIIQTERDDHIQDNNFALDLLNYQKELLQRIFTKLLSSLKNEAINEILADIYASYETVAQAFRQKLQIQYDLQDLEREYKRQKNSRVSQHLLIQLRKQIEDFRNELHKQKGLLSSEEQILERNFINLQGVEKEEKKIRNYTIQIEKKLKDIKSYNQTKRNSDDNSIQPKSSRIQFKATTKADEVMKEMVRRDRENIEKIFKETRSNYHKNNII